MISDHDQQCVRSTRPTAAAAEQRIRCIPSPATDRSSTGRSAAMSVPSAPGGRPGAHARSSTLSGVRACGERGEQDTHVGHEFVGRPLAMSLYGEEARARRSQERCPATGAGFPATGSQDPGLGPGPLPGPGPRPRFGIRSPAPPGSTQEGHAVAPARDPPDPYDVYTAFVRELASSPDCCALLNRLREGHVADQHGWGTHSGHAHRWEPHPCPILRLAALVESAVPRA
jgi:hypothetical protein